MVKKKSIWNTLGNWLLVHVSAVVLCWIVCLVGLCITTHLAMKIFTAILTLFLYWAVMTAQTWDLGNSDRNKVIFKHKEEDLWRGLKLGFVVSIPLFLMDALILLARAGYFPDFYIFFKLANTHFYLLTDLLDGTYAAGAVPAVMDISWGSLITICSLTFVTPIYCEIGYILGYKDILWADRLIYQNVKKSKNSNNSGNPGKK